MAPVDVYTTAERAAFVTDCWERLTAAVCLAWREYLPVLTGRFDLLILSQQIEILMTDGADASFLGGVAPSVCFRCWDSIMVVVVLKVTCLHFKLSVLGLNLFYGLLQAGRGNKNLGNNIGQTQWFPYLRVWSYS